MSRTGTAIPRSGLSTIDGYRQKASSSDRAELSRVLPIGTIRPLRLRSGRDGSDKSGGRGVTDSSEE